MARAGGRLDQSSGVDWLSTLGRGGRLPGAQGKVRTRGSSGGSSLGHCSFRWPSHPQEPAWGRAPQEKVPRRGVRVRRGRSGEEGCLGARGTREVGGPVSIPLAQAQQGTLRDATVHSARLDSEAESQTFTPEACCLKRTKAGPTSQAGPGVALKFLQLENWPTDPTIRVALTGRTAPKAPASPATALPAPRCSSSQVPPQHLTHLAHGHESWPTDDRGHRSWSTDESGLHTSASSSIPVTSYRSTSSSKSKFPTSKYWAKPPLSLWQTLAKPLRASQLASTRTDTRAPAARALAHRWEPTGGCPQVSKVREERPTAGHQAMGEPRRVSEETACCCQDSPSGRPLSSRMPSLAPL